MKPTEARTTRTDGAGMRSEPGLVPGSSEAADRAAHGGGATASSRTVVAPQTSGRNAGLWVGLVVAVIVVGLVAYWFIGAPNPATTDPGNVPSVATDGTAVPDTTTAVEGTAAPQASDPAPEATPAEPSATTPAPDAANPSAPAATDAAPALPVAPDANTGTPPVENGAPSSTQQVEPPATAPGN